MAGGNLKVLASDAPKLHGLSPTYVVLDELHSFADSSVYEAMRTALVKRPGARMLVISTAGVGSTSPLGVLRARALAQPSVKANGFLVNAEGPNLRMLEWAVPPDLPPTPANAAKANPASWLTTASFEVQRESLQDTAWRRYHLNQWVDRQGSWLPPGSWQACAGDASIAPVEHIWVAIDVGGGERSHTAVVWATEDLRIGSKIFTDDQGVLEAGEWIRELAGTYSIAEVIYDPWNARQLAAELEHDGLCVIEMPQNNSRLVPASKGLYEAVVQRRLCHGNDPALNRHVSSAIARDTPRGWRLDRPDRSTPIDGVIALAMAVERAEAKPEPVRLLGWL